MNIKTENQQSINQTPQRGDRCTDILEDTLEGFAGIQKAQLDFEAGKLRIDYDPRILSDKRALMLVKQAGTAVYERVNHCPAKSAEACAFCLTQLEENISGYIEHLSKTTLTPETNFRNGVMEIALPMNGTPINETASAEAHFVTPESRKIPASVKLSIEKIEILLTLITAIFGLFAFLSESSTTIHPIFTPFLYIVAFAAGGYFGLIGGIKELVQERRLNVDLLMILAAIGAAVIGQPAEGAVLLFLFSLSNTLQSYAMDRSRKAIEKLLDLRPPTATVRRGSRLVILPVEQLVIGDVVIVRPGERFPIDGTVISGTSTADQSSITGESIPVPKEPRDGVFAGTVNGKGSLEIKTTHLASDTTLAKIVNMVEDAQSSKARTQHMLDNFEQIYAVFVLAGAALLIVIPYFLLGMEFYPTFYRAMTWLVVASPCALVISTPASILSAIANGAKKGVLFKGGVYLERMSTLKVIAFDKTGTLTFGRPEVTQILPCDELDESVLLQVAASVESRSEHPLASAIVQAAEQKGLSLLNTTDFQSITGLGIEATIEDQRIWIGNSRMFQERRIEIPEKLRKQAQNLEDQGQTVMFVYQQPSWMGLVAVADTLRPDAADMVQSLKKIGIKRVVMLTGDNPRVASQIAQSTGVDEVHAGLLPQDKVRLLKQLREKYGAVAMIGDGINDAPALATADLGIAMGGAGTDVALETADVVLMADDLSNLPYAIGLSHETRKVVWQNITFSLAVIVLLVTTAFGAQLPLPLGVLGHEGSTVIVVLNGLRLLGYKQPK
jgi:Zn2+/Cd2+-exporting ATPase